MREENTTYPKHRKKNDYLLAGYLKCACNLTMQELNLKTELASLGQAISTNMLTNWEAKFNEYLEDLRAGIEELNNAAPETPEERHRLF